MASSSFRENKRIVESHVLSSQYAGVVYMTDDNRYSYWIETRVGGHPIEHHMLAAKSVDSALRHMQRQVGKITKPTMIMERD